MISTNQHQLPSATNHQVCQLPQIYTKYLPSWKDLSSKLFRCHPNTTAYFCSKSAKSLESMATQKRPVSSNTRCLFQCQTPTSYYNRATPSEWTRTFSSTNPHWAAATRRSTLAPTIFYSWTNFALKTSPILIPSDTRTLIALFLGTNLVCVSSSQGW